MREWPRFLLPRQALDLSVLHVEIACSVAKYHPEQKEHAAQAEDDDDECPRFVIYGATASGHLDGVLRIATVKGGICRDTAEHRRSLKRAISLPSVS